MTRGKLIILLFAGAIALGFGIWAGEQLLQRPVPPEISGFLLPDAKEIEPFTLVHHSNKPFTVDNFKGHWTLIYFGYTFCPDICPMSLGYLNGAQQQLAAQGLDDNVEYLLISVDPKRDTPEQLGKYTAAFNKKFQGATGSPEELEKLSKQFGVLYMFPEGQDKENYLVDHSSTIILIDPDGRLHAVLTTPHTPAGIVADFIKIREFYLANS